jgi:hypothetical protein
LGKDLRHRVQQVGHLEVTLVVQQRHALLGEGKVDQVVAFEVFIVLREPDQDVVGVQIAVVEAGEHVDRATPAPRLRLARMQQRVGEDVPVDQQAGALRIDAPVFLEEPFDISPRTQAEAQPLFQDLLRVDRLLEGGIRVPLVQQDAIGCCEDGPELALALVVG